MDLSEPSDSGLPSLSVAPPPFPEQHSWPNLEDYSGRLGIGPDTPVPRFRAKAADSVPGLRIDTDGSVGDTPSDGFGLASFGYDPRGGLPSSAAADSAMRRAESGTYPSTDPDYPSDFATPPRDRMQEALDQLAQIYAGVGGDRFLPGQSPHTDRTMTAGDAYGGAPSPNIGDVMDPQHIVPVNRPTGPPPGIGDNSGRVPKPAPVTPSQTQPQAPRGMPSTQPPPDTAGPAAAADAAAKERAAATFNTYREQLRALDPDNPLLKLEPVPGVTPEQPTVESFGKEVRRIVREKVERAVTDLSAQSTYERRSTVRTVPGQVDLRAEFDRLKSGGKRVDGAVANTAVRVNSTSCQEVYASVSAWPMICELGKSVRYRPWMYAILMERGSASTTTIKGSKP